MTALLAGCATFHHVPPGQSAAFSLARKPELVALPPSAQPTPAPAAVVAPPLPDTEKIADSFTLGNLCLEQGHNEEAAKAYETVVTLNPNFAEAWNKLAIAYQNLGEEKKALAAFKKYKTVTMQ